MVYLQNGMKSINTKQKKKKKNGKDLFDKW